MKPIALAILAAVAVFATSAFAATTRTVPNANPQIFEYEPGEADNGKAFVEFHWDSVNYLEVMQAEGSRGREDWNSFRAALDRDTSGQVRITTQEIGKNLNLCIDADENGDFRADFCGTLAW